MDKEEFFGAGFFGKLHEFFPSGVAGEVEFIDDTIQLNLVGAIKSNDIA